MKHFSNKKVSFILVFVFVAAITLCSGCKKETVTNSTTSTTTLSEVQTLGEGNTEFTFTVTGIDGEETVFNIKTDAATVGDALLNLNLIAGEDGAYGLYVKTVNGITVDYDKDGKYWAFYIDGEYGMSGVDATAITPGSTYSFKVE